MCDLGSEELVVGVTVTPLVETPPAGGALSWSGRGRFLPEQSIAASLLERLLHHNNVVATDGESHRMKEARTRSGGRPSQR